MNSKKQIKALVALATLISTSAISNAAFAGDAKVYPGSQCYLANPTSSNLGSIQLFGGQVINVSNFTVEVNCPVVRDITGGTENGKVGPTALVHVYNNNAASTTIECDLRAYGVNQLGPTGAQFQRLTKVVNGGAPGTPGKSSLFFDGRVQQTPGGAYEIRCNLPARTGVGTYTVTE
ncbi:hypothetical protein [Merismopedia glauca]|uniref:Uncharacterized protein n=1 Tax=Merismopedia glauca CCAP 1448/3 TaxID=1296344 RepID=A0A2T1C4F2_9CYAN|nr:hypothetical protein [Merismopedia glauca]PSB03162.1 hypothetical protein C7B64_09785 [Merismopedia glauca CCAP 1448/3]